MTRHFTLTAAITWLLHIKSSDGFCCTPQLSRSAASRSDSCSNQRYLSVSSNTQLQASLLTPETNDTIQQGRIAVVPNFISPEFVARLRQDAQHLHAENHFTTDALASYGTDGKFDPTKDRAVLKLQQWKDPKLGDTKVRADFQQLMANLRADVSQNLHRPGLSRSDAVSVTAYGQGSTEISYTRFGPGACLRRHVDEHHEELKASAGWSQPTRRSISWLIYLNQDWDHDNDGGQLRCFERKSPLLPGMPIGRSSNIDNNGDLQIGWLRATLQDPFERPVFLEARHHGPQSAVSDDGNVAMYILDNGDGSRQYISKRFHANPALYVAGSEALMQKVYLTQYASRFHFIEPPKSRLNDFILASSSSTSDDEIIKDVDPVSGTLVLFDSVALPHEVLATTSRERWATSGWMHEDQQPVRVM